MSSTSDPPSRPISEPVPSLLRSSASSLASEEWGRDEEGFGGQSSVQLNADNEDVMNVPCKFAPHRPHDLGSILSGARKPTSEEVERLKKRRAELERKIEEERLEHAHEEFPASEIQGLRGLSLVELQEKGVAVPLANGIAAVEPRELESLLGSNGKDEITTEGKALSSSRFLVTDTPPRQRRAASPPDYDMSSSLHGASTLTTPSSNSSHIQSANTCYTPFTKTLHYFKQFTSTKNTPAKSRRNASLPEEIAELAKTARGEACEDNEDLDKYRGMDIGPLEPVMDDRWADNLIMLGSPGPRKTRRARYVVGEDKRRKPTCEMRDDVDSAEGTKYEFEIPGHFGDHVKMTNRTNAAAGQVASFIRQKGRGLEVSDEDTNEAVENCRDKPASFTVTTERSSASSCLERDMMLVDVSSNEAHDPSKGANATTEDTKETAHVDERVPASSAYVHITHHTPSSRDIDSNSDPMHNQLILYHEQPVFITVIGMIPVAMFWTVAQPLAHYSSKAFDKVMQKLSGL